MIAAALRVKNEARWLARCLRSLDFCERVVLFDDHSTDETVAIASEMCSDRLQVLHSPFEGLDEARDKNYLLQHALALEPRWIVCPDGDEEFSPAAAAAVKAAASAGGFYSIAFRMLYLWDREDQLRADGVYGRFYAPRAYATRGQEPLFSSAHGAGFHCGSVPRRPDRPEMRLVAPIFHYGYLDPAERARKLAFYRGHDPRNLAEDDYRHITQGDPGGEPAEARLVHAGPLRLERLSGSVSH